MDWHGGDFIYIYGNEVGWLYTRWVWEVGVGMEASSSNAGASYNKH